MATTTTTNVPTFEKSRFTVVGRSIVTDLSDLQLPSFPTWFDVDGKRFSFLGTSENDEGETLSAHYLANDYSDAIIYND